MFLKVPLNPGMISLIHRFFGVASSVLVTSSLMDWTFVSVVNSRVRLDMAEFNVTVPSFVIWAVGSSFTCKSES